METRVKDIMKKNPEAIASSGTLAEAARKMQSIDCGVLPVGTAESPEGIITDRDIVLRAVAEGKDVRSEKIKDYMTAQLFYCNESDTLEQAAQEMHAHHVNRLLVRDEQGKTCGILTFGCILRKGRQMSDISKALERTVGKKAA